VVTAAAVEEAQRRAAEAAALGDAARAALAERRLVVARARDARALAEREIDRHASSRTASEADATRTAEEQLRLADELSEARAARSDAESRLAAVRAEVDHLARSLPVLDEAVAAWQELADRRRRAVARQQEFEVRVAGVVERRRVLAERQAEVERRLQGHAEERATAASRRQRLESEGLALTRLEGVVEGEQARLEGIFDTLRRDYQDQVDAVRAGGARLEQLRQDRHRTEQRLGEVRAKTRSLDLESNEVALRSEALAEHISRDLGARAEDLVDLPAPEVPGGTALPAHAEELERKLAALGPVNPLALEELSTLEERHKELEVQVDDVRGARRELHEVVRTLDHEIMTSFAAAAADVNEHFSALVAMLFPGGTGRLVLMEPDDLLNTGVEIEVRPAGRNVRRVSLLSGGERSMAALAFLFAVFRSRPSPFYLMDEVEAALDDVNLHRFLGLVREFRHEAQLLIVSHQKRTMETGDALYGVTMAPGGSSQVVSQKVEKEAEPA
jgi:chromosome segregation protein